MKRFKLLSCSVFQREVCHCLVHTGNIVDPEFVELGLHAQPATLRQNLQARIDAAETGGARYDAILLAYGICGNACVGLRARSTPLVIPRAHDCATILLGSKARYAEVFGDNPSRPFSSRGYLDRGAEGLRTDGGPSALGMTMEDLAEKYGEDNAQYIWETLHPVREDEPALFIDIPETSAPDVLAQARGKLSQDGREFVLVPGSINLIRNLVNGPWDEDSYLVVPPGSATKGVYDMDRVITRK